MKLPFIRSNRIQDISSRVLIRLRKTGRLKLDLPLAVLLVSLAIAFVVRYCTAAQHLDMGDDIANYLSTMNTLFGRDVAGFGLNRPPLIGVMLKPFTLVFGDLVGVKVLGVLLSLGLGIPFYLLAKRICRPWMAVVVTLLFVFTPDYSDLLTWGYLTMFGLLFTMLTLYFLLLLLEKPSKVNIFLTGASISLIMGFHQLSLAFFVPMFGVLIIALLVFNRQRLVANYRPLLAAIVIAVVLSTPYLPIYLRMVHMQATTASHLSVSLTPLAQIRADLSFGTDVAFVPWLLGMIILPSALAAVALRWMWQQDKRTAVMLAVVLLYSLGLILFVLPPPFAELNRRAHYFLYVAVWLLAGVVLSRLWSWQGIHKATVRQWLPRLSAIIIILALLSTTMLLSLRQLRRSLDFYGYLDDTRWSAVNWIKDNTPQEASVVAYPETLGWWIEAEGRRNTVNVTDRDTVPLTYLKERSLTAERILSRNQGIDNGNLRLATTYPYSGAPGNPVLGVYVGGSYHDILMFDDGSISLIMQGGEIPNVATDSQEAFSTSGDSNSMIMTTTYQMEGATLVQTAALDRASHNAIVSYNIQSDGAKVAELHIPLFFGFEPESVSIDPGQNSIEVIQAFPLLTDPVVTQIDIGSSGAILDIDPYQENRLDLSFPVQGTEAEITFSFVVTDPNLDSRADVTYYQVPDIIREYSIEYLAVDLKPNPNLANELPRGTEEWLNSCRYYHLVYPLDGEGDVRIYQVDTSALPLL